MHKFCIQCESFCLCDVYEWTVYFITTDTAGSAEWWPFVFFGVPNNTNQMNLVCLQSHDNLVLDGQPSNQQLTVVNTITYFENMKKLDGEIQNVWSLSYTYVVNEKLFLEYSEQSIIEVWKLSHTWNPTLKENLWPMWIQCPVFSPAQSSCRVTTFFSRVLLQ